MKSKYPIKINGYIYSPGTRKGFLRMARQGFPRPLFFLQDRLAKILAKRYKALVRRLMKDIRIKMSANGVVMDAAPEDDAEWLLSLSKQLKQSADLAARTGMSFIANELYREWFDEDQEELARLDEQFTGDIDRVLKRDQKEFLGRLMSDADDQTERLFESFSIDKKELFDKIMGDVRKLYVDNSLKRIAGEEDWLKREMLKRINSWATNEADELTLDDLTKYAYERGDHIARLFARDQMQRFNKAVTLATYQGAKVTKVKWVTCGDQRVRDSHRELNGLVFDIDKIPAEKDDYNCRCGLVPVEWAE